MNIHLKGLSDTHDNGTVAGLWSDDDGSREIRHPSKVLVRTEILRNFIVLPVSRLFTINDIGNATVIYLSHMHIMTKEIT